MVTESPPAPDEQPIEFGASRGEGTLRYWLAKEAVSKGELFLGSQISALARLMTSATSILGWSVTISLALTGVIASSVISRIPSGGPSNRVIWPAATAEVLLIVAAVCCVCVLWPGRWRPPGHHPGWVLNPSYGTESEYATELEVLESMARGYVEAVERNATGLARLDVFLRAAWVCFVMAPVSGFVLYIVL
jgi:hypothetical protein